VVERKAQERAKVDSPAAFEPGAKVVHKVFGEGTVKGIEGPNVVIAFDKHGEKSLALEVVKKKRLLRPAEVHAL
jgi:hypothetical protein